MLLSEVLDKYYVMALNASEIVGWQVPDPPDELIEINWTDSDTLERHEQYFNDQEIELLDHPRGGFYVVDGDGRSGGFIALDGVELRG